VDGGQRAEGLEERVCVADLGRILGELEKREREGDVEGYEWVEV
jgi:hypothetical protein